VIVTDGQRVGSHSVQYIVQDFSTSEVRIHTGDWTLGVPTDLTFVQFDPNGPEYIVVSTPGVPQAVSVEVPDFNDPSGPLDVSFLEVGLGASVVHGREGAVGDTRDNDFDGLFFGDSVNAEVRRFDSSDAP
jgi:hypothetical protein